jgi:hypothetical protein
MKTPRVLQLFACVGLAALGICGQPTLAQESHHRLFMVVPGGAAERVAVAPERAPAPTIYPLQATLTQINPTEYPNADGSDLWPCFGFGSAGAPNTDCPTVGNPSIPLPVGGAVLGVPQYVWKLANNSGYGYGNGEGNGNGCDALINGTTGPLPVNGSAGASQYKPCGQIATWYEDDSNDPGDDLLQRIVIRQGTRVIYDSGTVDYGPAPANIAYPVSVILSTDANFGFWPGQDQSTGPNNGNCRPNTGYPLTSTTYPGAIYVVESGQTCHEPLPGLAIVSTSTVLATPAYKKVSGAACTSKGVSSPCYQVEWTRNHEIRQDFNIFLE